MSNGEKDLFSESSRTLLAIAYMASEAEGSGDGRGVTGASRDFMICG